MPTFEDIYARHAAEYDALVSREDHAGNIRRALADICPLDGVDAVDMGAGTGRLSGLLATRARRVIALDRSAHMLETTRHRLSDSPQAACVTADNRALPLADGCADLVVEGWSFGHATQWYADSWQAETRAAIGEMFRALRPGGWGVLFETMGTGSEAPAPPNPALAALYAWLEHEQGFAQRTIRTDYAFASVEEAAEIAGFFFGGEMAAKIQNQQWRVLPEWTGVWWKQKEIANGNHP